ncbi:sensor histidine kinase [Bacillus massiliigorillae]|uniref:sensor histidine kinase n=1 Tax=Bacillus massiliigorillae TaxID=1243664 RepID=UPI0005AA8495|nr:ATP-binding protein [Bacillus massiliigorillae]
MKNNIRRSLHLRLILVFVYSLVLSAVTSTVLLLFLYKIYKNSSATEFIGITMRKYYYGYGLSPFVLALILIFQFIYFIWLIRKWSVYFTQVEHVTMELSEGNFDVKIPKDSTNIPLHVLENLELMKRQLDYLIKEEKRVSNLKNELITNVSHDLRTPLTSMIGYLQLIESNKYKDEVELMYYADIAYEKSIRLKRMVNDLFEFTKLQNDEIVLNTIRLNLNELLKQLVAQFLPESGKRGVCIDLVEKEMNVIFQADPDKLVRVFENIISNALKYGYEGKDIDIIVDREDGFATVTIVNIGDPIPQAAIPLLFDRLYRVESSRSSETGGTGLGLAIAKGIVDSHRGSIEVTSNEQRTSFKVLLPLSPEK